VHGLEGQGFENEEIERAAKGVDGRTRRHLALPFWMRRAAVAFLLLSRERLEQNFCRCQQEETLARRRRFRTYEREGFTIVNFSDPTHALFDQLPPRWGERGQQPTECIIP
jgi:hypothetical protein